MMNNNNYYGGDLYSVERATLAEDLIFKEITDIKAKFFVEIMTPGNELGSTEVKVINRSGYKKSNYITLDIPASILFNCVSPTIRTLYVDESGYINTNHGRPIRIFSMDFKNAKSTSYKIPKGTEFLIEFITGSTSAEDCRIIGTYESNPKILEV